ncbi:MAG: hypothetical protein CMP10_16475 [Zetaproteobacteria bacterium]|nr:hypothetical protein [Pseudobdellovibrionaceae bacterium]
MNQIADHLMELKRCEVQAEGEKLNWIKRIFGITSVNSKVLSVDIAHQAVAGILMTLVTPIAIVVAKQTLGAGDMEAAFLQSALMVGLVLSLFYANWTQKLPLVSSYVWPRVLGVLLLFIFFLVGLLGYQTSSWAFTFQVTLASILLSLSMPQLSVIYGQIYDQQMRGKAVATTRWFNQLAAALTAWWVGDYLKNHPEYFAWIYLVAAFLGFLVLIPMGRLDVHSRQKSFHIGLLTGFRLVLRDRNFSLFLLFQFMLGVANLCGLFAFYLYINNDEYLGLDLRTAAWLMGGIPPIAMLISVRFWGGLFDRIGIVRYRAVTNVVMAVGFMIFVIGGSSLVGLVLGSFCWGLGRAGGQLAWTIGILAFGQGSRAPVYLRVHTFLTGVRGIFAPFFGTWVLAIGVGPQIVFSWSAFFIFLSAVLTVKYVSVPKS